MRGSLQLGMPGLLLAVALGGAGPAACAQEPDEPQALSVQVEGLDDDVRESVLPALTIYAERDEEHARPEIFRMHRGVQEEVREALRTLGYYEAEVTGTLTEGDGEWEARYSIDTGPAVEIEELDIRITGPGRADDVLLRAVDAFPLEEGDALRHDAYEEGKALLEAAARERGYFDAAFTQRSVPVDLQEHSARVLLHLETGERHRFGPVRFRPDIFDEGFLGRFVPFERGEPYRGSRVLELQEALSAAGLVRSVGVRIGEGDASGLEVPLTVQFVPPPRGEVELGAGYGTDTGPRGTATGHLRRLTRSGHELEVDVRVSLVRRALSGRYRIPRGGPQEEWSLSAGFRDDDLTTYQEQALLIGASRGRERGGWRETLGVDLIRSWFAVGDRPEEVTTLVLPGAEWMRTRLDAHVRPRRGHEVSLGLQGTARALGSDVALLQGMARGRWIHPVGETGRLLARGDMEATWVDDFSRLPGSYRAFVGGDASVRGFGYRSVGPRPEVGGETRGGRHLLVGSVEYERLLGDAWGFAVFYDAGGTLGGQDDRLEQGAGVGVRWISPLGLVGVDVATPLSRSGFPLRLHAVLGQR